MRYASTIAFRRSPSAKTSSSTRWSWVLNLCGIAAKRASRGNPGHDITIRAERFSLKTQADKNVKLTHLHISKFIPISMPKESRDLALLGRESCDSLSQV